MWDAPSTSQSSGFVHTADSSPRGPPHALTPSARRLALPAGKPAAWEEAFSHTLPAGGGGLTGPGKTLRGKRRQGSVRGPAGLRGSKKPVLLRTRPAPAPRLLPRPGRALLPAASEVTSPLLPELRPRVWGVRERPGGTHHRSAIKEDRAAAASSRSRAAGDVRLVTLCLEARPDRAVGLRRGRHTANTETQT